MKAYFINRRNLFTELYRIDSVADEVKQSTHRLRVFYSTGQEAPAREEIRRLGEIAANIRRITTALQNEYDYEGMAKLK